MTQATVSKSRQQAESAPPTKHQLSPMHPVSGAYHSNLGESRDAPDQSANVTQSTGVGGALFPSKKGTER